MALGILSLQIHALFQFLSWVLILVCQFTSLHTNLFAMMRITAYTASGVLPAPSFDSFLIPNNLPFKDFYKEIILKNPKNGGFYWGPMDACELHHASWAPAASARLPTSRCKFPSTQIYAQRRQSPQRSGRFSTGYSDPFSEEP